MTSKELWKAWLTLDRRLDSERGLRADLGRRLSKKRGWPTKGRSIETMFCRWFKGDWRTTPSLKRTVDIFSSLEAHDGRSLGPPPGHTPKGESADDLARLNSGRGDLTS